MINWLLQHIKNYGIFVWMLTYVNYYLTTLMTAAYKLPLFWFSVEITCLSHSQASCQAVLYSLTIHEDSVSNYESIVSLHSCSFTHTMTLSLLAIFRCLCLPVEHYIKVHYLSAAHFSQNITLVLFQLCIYFNVWVWVSVNHIDWMLQRIWWG